MTRKGKKDQFTDLTAGKGSARLPAREYRRLLAILAEIEQLVQPPLLPSEMERIKVLAAMIARNAPPGGSIAELAMRLLSAIHDARTAGESGDSRALRLALARMREAIGDKGNA